MATIPILQKEPIAYSLCFPLVFYQRFRETLEIDAGWPKEEWWIKIMRTKCRERTIYGRDSLLQVSNITKWRFHLRPEAE